MIPHRLSSKTRKLRLQSGRTQKSMTGFDGNYVYQIERMPPVAVRKFDQYLRVNFAHQLTIEPITAPLDLRGRLRNKP